MATYKSSARWTFPIWLISGSSVLLACGLAASLFTQVLPVPTLWLAYGASALCVGSSAASFIWFRFAVSVPLARHQERLNNPDAMHGANKGLGQVLDGFANTLRETLVEVSDATLSDGVRDIQLRFSGDAAARLEKLAQNIEESDAWLRARQNTLTDLHAKVAEQTIAVTQDIQTLNETQRSQQGDIRSFLQEIPAALGDFQAQLSSWSNLDPSAVEATQARLRANADALSDLVAGLEIGVQDTQGASTSLNAVVEKVDIASSDFSGAVDESVEALNTAQDQIGKASAQLTTLVLGGRAGLLRALKGVADCKADLDAATQQLTKSTTDITDHADAFTQSAQSEMEIIQSAARGFHDASNTTLTQLRADLDTLVTTAQSDVGDAASVIEEQSRSILENSTADLKATCNAHANVVAQEVETLSGYAQVLADARQAAQSATAMAGSIQAQSDAAGEALHKQIENHQSLFSKLSDMAEPARAKMESLAAIDSDKVAPALAAIEALTADLNALKEAHSLPQLEVLGEKLERMQVQSGTAVTLLETLYAAEETNVQNAELTLENLSALKDICTPLSQASSVDNLGGQLGQLEETVRASLETASSAITSQQASQADSAKALRTQIRKLGERLSTQNEDVSAGLKDMRASQLQALKHSIRAVPDAVTQQLTPLLSSDVHALQARLETLVGEALAKPAQAGAQAQGPEPVDEAELDLSERLASALAAMNKIEEEVTGLATAALAVPQEAGGSDAFAGSLKEAEQVLTAWGGKLDNIATAIALARDAA